MLANFCFHFPRDWVPSESCLWSVFLDKICIAAKLFIPLSCFLDEPYLYQDNDLQILALKKGEGILEEIRNYE